MRPVLLTAVVVLGASVSCMAAEDGLVGHWRFDSAAGSVADLSGHGHNAQVSNAKTAVEGGKTVLLLDGRQNIQIPSAPEFNLQRGFSIVAKVKFTALTGYQTIVRKEGQFDFRLDPPQEGGRLSFFPFTNGQWEPRVSAIAPTVETWHHLVAIWNGANSFLWIDGLPFSALRGGNPPAANDKPLVIGGLQGAVEFVKIYRRALSSQEIMCDALEVPKLDAASSAVTNFDFTSETSLGGWTARAGAALNIANKRLVVGMKTPQSLILNNRLGADIDKKDFVSLRMAVDKGSRATLTFITTKGAGQIPFQIFADQKPHTYVLDAWTWTGWGGKLLALGVAPSDVEGSTAQVEYLNVVETPQGAPEIQIDRVFTESTLPRAQRPERITVRLRNPAGTAKNLTATLTVPEGVQLKSAASQTIASLGHRGETEVVWNVEASRPCSGAFLATITGGELAEPASGSQTIAFQAALPVEKAEYVPVPVPVKTKYTLWTHYCALWKHGTHYGWKLIEPWPERKPVIGWYDEGTPEVADWQIKYMVEHGISGVMYCWYRSSVNEPVKQSLGHALHDGLLKARYLSMIKFGIMWENGCAQGVASEDDLMKNVLPFWIDNYFSNPSYIRIDGRPVLYVWVPSNLRDQLGGSANVRKALDWMRAECKRRGLGGLYLVACVQSQDKPALEAVAREGWDSTSAYGNSWIPPAKLTTVGDYVCAPAEGFADQQEALWKFKRGLNLLPDIPAVMMGWDSRPWKSSQFFWADNTPEKFRNLCQRAKAVIDSSPTSGPSKNTAIFCCWNELGEGHYIEPTRGYGFSYLDVIRDTFCEGPKQHVDIAPEDVGRGPLDSWYRAAREKLVTKNQDLLHQTAWSGDGLSAWNGIMGFDNLEVRDGMLHAATTTRDPAIASPAMEIRASRYTKAIVEMRLNRPAGSAQLFWSTTGSGVNGDASVVVNTVADSQWHSYVFEVAKNQNWGGCVTSLRFDPASEEGVTVEIKSIRLE